MMKLKFSMALCGVAFVPSLAFAQNAATVVPLSTFGNGGYLAPITTTGTQRGLAFNPLGVYDAANSATIGGGDLYTALTNGTIDIISASSGIVEGTLGSASSFTGGNFAIDSIAVAQDGAIYVDNLVTNSSTSPYKIYRYANEAAGTGASPVGPTVAFTGSVGAVRLGDDLAVTGTGTSTVLASGFGTQPTGGFQNGYAITTITAPTGNTSTAVTVSGVTGHDFSSGITFGANANNVLGSQGGTTGSYRDTTYSGSTGTLVATASLTAANPGATAEHLLATDVVDGVPLLAAQSTSDGHVSIYDDTNPASPVLLEDVNVPATDTTTSSSLNGNGTGELAFGTVFNTNEVDLYTLSTNEGINAYTITVTPAAVPEPASLALFGLAVPALLARRRRI